MKFKRGINITLSPKQSVAIPNDEVWKVAFPTEYFSTSDGNPSRSPKINGEHPIWRNPVNVLLGPGTGIFSDEKYLNLTGVAFTAD